MRQSRGRQDERDSGRAGEKGRRRERESGRAGERVRERKLVRARVRVSAVWVCIPYVSVASSTFRNEPKKGLESFVPPSCAERRRRDRKHAAACPPAPRICAPRA